jgi:hypothetical protein
MEHSNSSHSGDLSPFDVTVNKSMDVLEFTFNSAHFEEDEKTMCSSRFCKVFRDANQQRITLSDILQTHSESALLLLSPGPPYFVTWTNQSWSSAYGWSAEELVGLDLSFVKGTDASVSGFELMVIYNVSYTEQSNSFNMTGYRKNGDKFACKAYCFPVFDYSAMTSSWVLCNIAINLVEDFTLSYFDRSLILNDRRKDCTLYATISPHDTPEYEIPSPSETFSDTIDFVMEHSLSEIMICAATTSSCTVAVVITDRYRDMTRYCFDCPGISNMLMFAPVTNRLQCASILMHVQL